MTVSTEVNQAAYTGNGVTTVFPYPFRILKDANLTVTLIAPNELEKVLTIGTDYTVSGAGSYSGGAVILPQALSVGYSLVIERDLAIVQETDLRNQGTFFAETHEDAFDYLTMIIQQIAGWLKLALRRPTVSSKFYDAKQFRIANVSDPINGQDAVNNRTLNNALADLSVDGSGEFVLKVLADTSDATQGDAKIGVQQLLAGSLPQNQHEVNRVLVDIRTFGGSALRDDNSIPLQLASEALGVNGIIYFPNIDGGNYKFGPSTLASWTANRYIKTDHNVTLTTPDNGYFHSTTRFMNEVKGHFSNLNVEFYYPQSFNINKADRPIWTGMASRDVSSLIQIQPNSTDINVGLRYLSFNQNNDTVSSFTPVATSISGYQLTNSDVLVQQVGMLKIDDGDEYSAIFNAATGSSPITVLMVRTTGGRYWYTCGASSLDNPVRQTRPIGGPTTSTPIAYQGVNTTPAYKYYDSDITIRRNSSKSFSVQLNGFTIDTVSIPLGMGEIIEVGFGVTGTGGLTVSEPVKRIFGQKDNGQFLNVCAFGDSITASSMNGGWPDVLKKSFDGMNGIRFPKVDNYAIAGADSAAQLATMASVNLSSYNLCLIMLGVNDIQGGVTGNSFLNNMTNMINNAANNGCKVIVAAPTIYYGQAQSGGNGQPTTRQSEGRYHRAGLRRLCSSMGIKYIEMNNVIGPVLPDYVNTTLNPALSSSGDDTTLNDNIHPTPNTKYLMARAFYEAIAGIYAPKAALSTPVTPLSGSLGAGWAFASGNDLARWYRDDLGVIHLDGLLNYSGGSSPANGSLVFTLPPQLTPSRTSRFLVWADAVNARLNIDSSGQVTIYQMTSGSWVSLSGISFKGTV